MTRPVRIVGLGSVTALGNGVEALMSGLAASRRGFRPPRRFEPLGVPPLPVAEAALAAGPGRAGALGLHAAQEALAESGWTDPERASPRTLLVIATTKGEIERLTETMAGRAEASEARASLIASLSSELARTLGMAGPVESVSLACASGLAAAGLAARALRTGEVDRALVVGADAVSRFIYRGFANLGALDALGARPFDEDRAGLTVGEGAAAVAMEVGHGDGDVLLAGYGASNDANHITGPARDGRGLVQALETCLIDAELEPETIGFAVVHGTATRFNDAMEGVAYARVFGTKALPVMSVKGAVGHLMGAAGLLNLVVTTAALREGRCPPTAGLRRPDPEIPLDVVHGQSRPVDTRAVVTSASGFGGVNAALALTRNHAGRAFELRPAAGTQPAAVITARAQAPTLREALIERVGARAARRLDGLCLKTVAAAESVLTAASLDPQHLRRARHALFLGTGLGSLTTDVAYYARELAPEDATSSPRLFAYTLPNVALGELAIRFELSGEHVVLCAGPLSALYALHRATRLIEGGFIDVGLVFAAEDLSPAAAGLLGIDPAAELPAHAWVVESQTFARARGAEGPRVRGTLLPHEPPAPEPLSDASGRPPFDASSAILPLGLDALDAALSEGRGRVEARSPQGLGVRLELGS